MPPARRLSTPFSEIERLGMSHLLGIDEGTSAVKAVLFDTDLKPVTEARREKPLDHPKPGWVEQDPEVIVSAVVEAVAELLGNGPEIVDTAGDLGTLSHDSWPIELPLRARFVDQQAALAGAGCVEPGLVKATYGTGVFVLAHAGTERPEPGGGLLPTVAWRINGRVEWAIDGGVFTAGALLEWMSRDLGLAADPPALAAAAADVEDDGGVRVLPALAGVGAPWWKSEARAVC